MVVLVVKGVYYIFKSSFGYVYYRTVDEAKQAFLNQGSIELDGRIVFTNFVIERIDKHCGMLRHLLCSLCSITKLYRFVLLYSSTGHVLMLCYF